MTATPTTSSSPTAPAPSSRTEGTGSTSTVYITLAAIAAVAVIIIVVLLRDRITRVVVRALGAEVSADAAPPPAQPVEPDYSVDFSGNKFKGKGGTFHVSRDSFRAKDNVIEGERDFIFESAPLESSEPKASPTEGTETAPETPDEHP